MSELKDYIFLTKVTQQDLDEGVWDAEHKGLYSKDGKRFLQYMRPKSLERGVPDTFQLKTGVEVICEKAFAKGFFPLTSFIIPKSVVAIGDEAFQQIQLPRHANFTITKGLKYIGCKILGNYEGILNLIIEEGIKEIDLSYILNCAPAVTLYLPSTLESIGDKGFGEVDNTEHIHLAEGNKHFRLDNGILYNYDKTELLRCPVTKRGDFIIPEGVTTIGAYAFRLSGYKDVIDAEPESKLSVVLPQSLTTIKKGAFRHTWIDSIFIPANVSEIEEGAFEYPINLKIGVSPENKNFEVCNNMLIDKRAKKVLNAMSNKVVIPNGIMEIADHALGHLQSKRIVIPEGVTRVGENNLNLNKALKICLPSTLQDVARSSFWGFSVVPHTMIEVPTGMGKEFKEKLHDSGDYDISSYIQEKKNSIIYDSSDLLKISEDGKTVLGVYDNAITAIVIPYGIEVIGECAFQRCSLMREIVIPPTVRRIGEGAFYGCKYLHSINLPSHLTKIESLVFYGCQFLDKIDIPSSVEEIGVSAFNDCSSLKKIELPHSLKKIESSAFHNCSSLRSIRIPGSVKSLDGFLCFWKCEGLREIEIEEGVEVLDSVFSDCTSVKTIVIPNSLKNVDGYSFECMPALKNIVLAKDNPNFVFIDGVLYSKDRKRLIRYLPKRESTFEVPKSVRTIDKMAFRNCRHLEEIILHDSIREIDCFAFEHCIKLKKIILPSKLKKLGNNTFFGCSSLSEVVIPDGLIDIGWWNFGGCKLLTHLHLPGTLRHISTGCASSIRSYTVSSNNKYLTAIDGIVYDKKVTKLLAVPKEIALKTIKIPQTVTEIDSVAFSDCKKIKHIILPKGLKKIGHSVFENCISLQSIELPDGIEVIPERAFYGCKALKTIKLPHKLKRIDEGAFAVCDSLNSLSLPPSVKCLGSYPFPKSLKELHISYKDPKETELFWWDMFHYLQNEEGTILYVPKGTKENFMKDEADETLFDKLTIEEEP